MARKMKAKFRSNARAIKKARCGRESYAMSTRRGMRCVRICSTYGSWKIPRFAKTSTCKGRKARSWRSIAGGR